MQKIDVDKIEKWEKEVTVQIKTDLGEEQLHKLEAGGRMLVDSDQLAFLYILEDQDFLHYIVFSAETWDTLAEIHHDSGELRVKALLGGDLELELTNFQQELTYLIENISGNGNYGDRMESAVYQAFQH